MSDIAGLLNVPSTPEQLASWSATHMAHHRDIIRVIYQVLHIALPEYLLDPFDPDNLGGWDDLHQTMHNQMDTILGIQGFNLLDPDFRDRGKLQGWVDLNFQDHYQAANILRIG